MSENNLALIKLLSDDFYHNRISYPDYRKKRTDILKSIDAEFNGIVLIEEIKVPEKSLINKALSFLKLDNFKEQN